jgi:hypothetical protein
VVDRSLDIVGLVGDCLSVAEWKTAYKATFLLKLLKQ